MTVPPDLNEILGILFRFRMHSFAVSAEIKEAFLNVGLKKENCDATRLYWFSDPKDSTSELTTYKFVRPIGNNVFTIHTQCRQM